MSRTRTLLGLVAASAAALALAACSTGAPAASDDASGDEYGLVKAGTLTVATEGTYRPFSFHEDGSGDLTGYDVEVAEAVADKLGLEVEFQETQWDAIFAGLDAGRFDVIANQVSINPEREEQYLFSEPYTVSPGRHRGEGGRHLDLELRRPRRQDHRAVAHEQLVRARAGVGRERRGRRGLGRRPSRCSSRAASTRPSTTS